MHRTFTMSVCEQSKVATITKTRPKDFNFQDFLNFRDDGEFCEEDEPHFEEIMYSIGTNLEDGDQSDSIFSYVYYNKRREQSREFVRRKSAFSVIPNEPSEKKKNPKGNDKRSQAAGDMKGSERNLKTSYASIITRRSFGRKGLRCVHQIKCSKSAHDLASQTNIHHFNALQRQQAIRTASEQRSKEKSRASFATNAGTSTFGREGSESADHKGAKTNFQRSKPVKHGQKSKQKAKISFPLNATKRTGRKGLKSVRQFKGSKAADQKAAKTNFQRSKPVKHGEKSKQKPRVSFASNITKRTSARKGLKSVRQFKGSKAAGHKAAKTNFQRSKPVKHGEKSKQKPRASFVSDITTRSAERKIKKKQCCCDIH